MPQGFSARGVVGDSGQFEMSTAKGLGAAALVGGAGVAAALGAAEKEPNRVLPVGEPFVTGAGHRVRQQPTASRGTISSSGGFLALELRIFSPDEVPNALVTATLFTSVGLAPCLLFSSRHDLPARQATAIVVNGPVRRESGGCGNAAPGGPLRLTEMRITVADSGGFRTLFETGQPGLPHIRVTYELIR